MPYSQFLTLEQPVKEFSLSVQEGGALLPYSPVEPSDVLKSILERELDWAVSVGTEKSRSEGIVLQLLLEVRAKLNNQISVFSGRSFDVDESRNLNGYCDFLISQSPQQRLIDAPVVAIVEAKKGDITLGWGQCVAEMVAASIFNADRDRNINVIYGAVTSGSLWQFVSLQGNTLTFDVSEYAIAEIQKILGLLVAMSSSKC